MAWTSGQKLQDGKYTIEQELGEGGFGITYRARDNNGRKVVIKTLNNTVQRRPEFAKFQQDFLNEALRLARCSHPHIVRVDEVIQEGQLWCMVMEYINGEDLANWVVKRGALPEAEALRYIQQIGEALTVVHNNGLLHRDIKPHNIMLRSGKSEAVLIDFGIAREFTQNLTQTHTQYVTDCFAPIEQYDKRSKRGTYTDVYALAATLYLLLTGEVPTIAPLRAIGTPLESPKQINPGISDRVNQAILVGLEVKAENRPQSVQEWLRVLKFEDVEDYHNQGLEKAKRGRYQEAIEDFTLELRLNPYSAKTYKYRGLAHSRLGDNQEAIKDFQKAAVLYQKQGQTEDYKDALERITKLQSVGGVSPPIPNVRNASMTLIGNVGVNVGVTKMSAGVETVGGEMAIIIPRNTDLPIKRSEIFSTAIDGQTNVEIHVLKGEQKRVEDNISLGTFRLDGIPVAPKGVPQIEVTFAIDTYGILFVSAKDIATGKQQSITLSN